MYHRVTDLTNDPHLLAVRPNHFAEQMEVIRRYYSPISLRGLVDGVRQGKVPSRAIAVTFDDGYADNLHYAKPILERYEIPATVFVTAGYVGSQREFWWDELDRLLLQPGTLPVELRLRFNGTPYNWNLCESSDYTQEDYQLYRDWHIERKNDPSPRHGLFRMLCKQLSILSAREKRKVIENLISNSNADTTPRSSHSILTTDDVNVLSRSGLVEIGAHTMTHPMLASLPLAEQRTEISQSKEGLEAIIERPVTTFAYPHGSYSRKTVAVLKEAGFSAACSTEKALVWRGSNCLRLPRLGIRDCDGDAFAQLLSHWFGS